MNYKKTHVSYRDKIHGCDELGEWYDEPRGDSHKLKVIEKYRNLSNDELEAKFSTLQNRQIKLSDTIEGIDVRWLDYRKMGDEIDDIIMEQTRRIHGGTEEERKQWRQKLRKKQALP